MSKFTFIDLFCGIGGMRLAFESVGGKCVFSSETSSLCLYTYEQNFGEFPSLDIRNIKSEEIPNHNVLVAGFPCQPFSQIGQQQGFEDIRGTLFFEIARILKDKQPQAFLLENVRNLKRHNNGRTLQIILKTLESLGYTTYHRVLKACDYGLPTLRPRMYIVGLRNDLLYKDNFKFPEPIVLDFTMSELFGGKCEREIGYTIRCGGRNSGINDRHNWDSYLVDGKVRKLTIKECYKLMGFPESFKINPIKDAALDQIGNSVAINTIKMIAERLKACIKD